MALTVMAIPTGSRCVYLQMSLVYIHCIERHAVYFTCTSLVFGSIWSTLLMGQAFWVSFDKLLTIVWWIFGPFLLTEVM